MGQDNEERIKVYFDLLKLKHEAVGEERYEHAAVYRDVLDNVEDRLFPYKYEVFYRKFESKLEKLGKTKQEISYALERFMLDALQVRTEENRDRMAHDKHFYRDFSLCIQLYLIKAAVSQHSPKFIEAFTRNYVG